MMLRASPSRGNVKPASSPMRGHELRTPLTSLRTNVELLMASMAPGAPSIPEDEMAGLRTDVIAQIEELSTLVGDLVDLSRDDAGVTIHEPVDLSEVVDRSLERVRRRRNDIEFDVDTVRWQVYGDEATLSRAVLNLLDNAAKWSPPGGRVGVRMVQVDANYAELVVSDQARESPSERELVFERFYRSTSARSMSGSGLGLAIVKQVVVKHGGTLRIDYATPLADPPGTSIYVLLPGRPLMGDGAHAGATREGGAVDGWPATPRMGDRGLALPGSSGQVQKVL